MTIWTVSATDDEGRYGLDMNICGSYTTRGMALDKCVELIMARFDSQPSLAYAMANDENHKSVKQYFREDKHGLVLIKRGMRVKFMEWLRDELGGQGCYFVYDGQNEYRFSVDENDVEGTIWQTVTWGDSDTEDPEFTTPWPEVFTSEETAVETFIGYVKDLYKSHCMKWSDAFIRETEKALKEEGKVQVNLNDGTSVSCVMYSGGANNVRE